MYTSWFLWFIKLIFCKLDFVGDKAVFHVGYGYYALCFWCNPLYLHTYCVEYIVHLCIINLLFLHPDMQKNWWMMSMNAIECVLVMTLSCYGALEIVGAITIIKD